VLKLLIAAAAGAAVAFAVAAAGVPATTGPATIRITNVQTKFHAVGGTPGHMGVTEIVHQRLFNPAISHPIGTGDLVCTYLDRRTRQCTATYSLPRGNLIVSGAIDSRLLFTVAIVGGTGLYDNARGTMTATATRLSPRREVLLFRLAG
jgi:hypothetical protein